MKMKNAFGKLLGYGVVAAAVGLISIAQAAPKEEVKPESPSARQILERYTKEIGGKEAYEKHDSQHAKGTVQMSAQNLNGKMDVYAARPNKLIIRMNLPGVGELNTAFNGKIGWIHSQLTGAMLLTGKMLDQIAEQADFDQALHDPDDYKSMEVVGQEEFEGEPCYVLKLVHKTGFESTEYFSKKTGLQKGFTATQESPLGPVTATTVVGEYRKFGNVLMPAQVTQKAGGIETVMTIESIQWDDVDPSVFEPPAEVKAQLAKPAAPEKVQPAGK